MQVTNRAYASLLPTDEKASLRVAEAISLCNTVLSDLSLRIEGEVASFSISRGKFVFFDLKDEQEEAKLSCFMMAYQLSTPLEDGMRVVLEGKPGLYQKNGQFRISVTRVEPKGEGSVKRAFELLRKKLQEEGLFSESRKRKLPRFARTVGIISSAEAAGFGDFQKIALSRLPGVQFLLVNVAVQGKDAESEICQAFDYLNGHQDLDAIVLIRGGGSMEDLHAFNSELVARAIVRSKTPVLVGVGHERDITIADYCADVRASTPSNAAQLLLPTREEVELLVNKLTQEGVRRVERTIQQRKEAIKSRQERMCQQILFAIKNMRVATQNRLKTITALSPQQTLKRGFSITCTAEGKTVTSIEDVQSGGVIITRVIDGQITSTVN